MSNKKQINAKVNIRTSFILKSQFICDETGEYQLSRLISLVLVEIFQKLRIHFAINLT
jgi:hypothetical protein